MQVEKINEKSKKEPKLQENQQKQQKIDDIQNAPEITNSRSFEEKNEGLNKEIYV